MSRNLRDLLHAGAYIFGLLALGSGLLVGAAALSGRVDANASFGYLASIVELDEDRPTVLSQRVASAREIREALSKPIAGPPPLQPISQKVAIGALLPGSKGSQVAGRSETRVSKLSKKALNAMASAEEFQSSSPAPRVELHKVY